MGIKWMVQESFCFHGKHLVSVFFFHSLRRVNEYKWVGKKNRSGEKLNLSNREEAKTRSTHSTWLHKGKRVTRSTPRCWSIGKNIGGLQLHIHRTSAAGAMPTGILVATPSDTTQKQRGVSTRTRWSKGGSWTQLTQLDFQREHQQLWALDDLQEPSVVPKWVREQ
jgi:hypothetical protein